MEASWSMTLGFHNIIFNFVILTKISRGHIFFAFIGPCPQLKTIYGELIMSDANIPVMLKDIEEVLQTARTVVETMQPGERKQIKELAQLVGAKLSREPKEVFNLINIFAHNTNIAYVTRGKNGGVVRGVKPVKTVKAGRVSKKAQADTSATTDVTTSTAVVSE